MKPVQVDILKYQHMVDSYHAETDRAAAVLAGSFMDEFTRKFIRSFMVPDDVVDNILVGYGPLSSFSSRIDCLYAFGFIDKEACDDLDLIRKIRNHFAHHPEQTSFDESPVRDFCSNLSTAKPMPKADGGEYRVENHRFQFLFAIGMIVVHMHNSILEREKNKP